MRLTTSVIAVAAWLGLGLGLDARADITLNIGAGDKMNGTQNDTAEVTFTQTKNAQNQITGAALSFTNFVVEPGSGTGAATELTGSLLGTYSYSIKDISTRTNGDQSATLDISAAQVRIKDVNGVYFTANVASAGIATFPSGTTPSGGVDGIININQIDYNGQNSDLLTLKNDANARGGTAFLTFTLKGNPSLTSIADTAEVTGNYAGAISSIPGALFGDQNIAPEPSGLLLAGLGAMGLIGYGTWRRHTAC